MKQKSRTKFLPWSGFEPRTSRLAVQRGEYHPVGQRRESVLKSGGREFGPRNFRFEPKKFQIFRINFSFSRLKFLTTFFSPQLKKIIKRRSLASLSYKKDVSYIKKTFSNILSVQNKLYFFRNPSTTPSPKAGGRDPPTPRIDAPAVGSLGVNLLPMVLKCPRAISIKVSCTSSIFANGQSVSL